VLATGGSSDYEVGDYSLAEEYYYLLISTAEEYSLAASLFLDSQGRLLLVLMDAIFEIISAISIPAGYRVLEASVVEEQSTTSNSTPENFLQRIY
jgi:hypothetical protein